MRILVTGERGKIGLAFLSYIKDREGGIQADTLSFRGADWREVPFSQYQAIYYCLGIVDPSNPDIVKVNAELAYEVAKKAKAEGVQKFIYLSSMAVYDFIGKNNMQEIQGDEAPKTQGGYGGSKLQGEALLKALASESFEVHIIRAPSIYGRNTEAYLSFIEKTSRWGYFDAFHDWKRSILYVDNLSELVCLIAETTAPQAYNLYYPQNIERCSYAEMVCLLSKITNKKRRGIKVSLKWERRLAKCKCIRRKYRPYMYSETASNAFDYAYCVVSLEDSIKECYNK